ncbi:uncharacterized protein LACBIDRAFT_292781 [Laccaria bicolor S238N-H82]|uniref:Predicted protein n=1 Tax=Laccaria bicolor (strain S238N-H82 / ATCC MYA-4686) TaxID=486041 RepID=B0CXP7_LACBS|nr:uncharacterized protein LACBIDRAFT_292781 [Laccaria bicolor S238N-H82]EDR12758.1 predicted protein [Laccaria bicolor S238N-H82]|eukprot:XP_001877022.1 predicted protein [Laccaria bicolor S238N-H82]
MGKSLTKVIYKPDSQSTDEFIVIVNPEEFKKWHAGDSTIPLAEVVDSFKVFHSGQGSQGLLGEPSKQQLDTVFGTHKDVDVVTHILKNGREQAAEGITKSSGPLNAVRGGPDNRKQGHSLGV